MVRFDPGARVNTVRALAGRELGVIRDVVVDVRERFDLSTGSKEPSSGAGLGGVFGERGNLINTAAAAVIRQPEILSAFVQENARLNRQVLRG